MEMSLVELLSGILKEKKMIVPPKMKIQRNLLTLMSSNLSDFLFFTS